MSRAGPGCFRCRRGRVGGARLKDLATRAAYLTWNVDSVQGVVDWLSQVTGSRVCLTEP
ncbi:hypothetical protein SBRY_40660 [Actinacidiphila bryophytorum]|uniref:Uncharacterized protein n=1 Tax=Actinacidiphila bryophytorum TaxID=1436133 RepID=A0A9W4H3A4_9ACTN|nr:hypothetical protein SBRY_40660 [Actinacidiphila bryophytorum]